MTPIPDAEARWTDPPAWVIHRADGSRALVGCEDAPAHVLDRLEAIGDAWRILHETGDRSHLVSLGILPDVNPTAPGPENKDPGRGQHEE